MCSYPQRNNSWLESAAQDAFVIESEDELDRLLGLILSLYPDSFIAYIQEPADLDRDELINSLSMTTEQMEPLSRPALLPGKLFSDSDVILVIDFRSMSPARIAEFNELYDNPPRLRGRELNEDVRIISLTSSGMKGTGGIETDTPGSDFWRRINDANNHWTVQELYDSVGIPEVTLSGHLEKMRIGGHSLSGNDNWLNKIEIDFPCHSDWHSAMFGGVGLDASASLSHKKGPMSENAGDVLYILKSAPWHDTRFKVRLANMNSNRGYEQFGECYGHASSYVFQAVDSEPLNQDRLSRSFTPFMARDEASRLYPVNSRNIDNLLNPVTLDKTGQLTKGALFDEVLRLYDGFHITSSVDERKWKQLAKFVEQQPSAPVSIQIEQNIHQPINFPPEFYRADNASSSVTDAEDVADSSVSSNLHIVLTHNEAETLNQLRREKPAAHEESILPDTQFQALLSHIELRSELESRFSAQPTAFLENLRLGKSVIMSGLASNGALQQSLESLLTPLPSVTLFGSVEPIPDPELWVLWPCSVKAASPLWQQAVNQSEYSANCDQPAEYYEGNSHGLPVINQDVLEKLFKVITRALMNSDPLRPENSGDLLQALLPLSELEMQMEGTSELSPWHLRKAAEIIYLPLLNEDITKQNKLAFQLRVLLPDPGTDNWVDSQWLARVVDNYPLIDFKWIQSNFWHIAQGIAPSLLGFNAENVLSAPPKKAFDVAATLLVQEAPEHWRTSLTETLKPDPDITVSQRSVRVEQNLQTNTSDQEQTALVANALINNTVIYLEGPAGSGKSYKAYEVATLLNPDVKPVVVTAGPNVDMGILYGQQKFENKELILSQRQLQADGYPYDFIEALAHISDSGSEEQGVIRINMTHDKLSALRNTINSPLLEPFLSRYLDKESHFQAGPIKQWAELRSPDPIVLIIDEANLAAEGQWNIFSGLNSSTPFISINGEMTAVTPMHKVIMTGNPASFSGRKSHQFIDRNAVKIPIHSHTPELLRNQVLLPALKSAAAVNQWEVSDQELDTVADAAMELLAQYRHLLPLHAFSPRDLLDVVSRLSTYSQHWIDSHPESKAIDLAALTGSLWQAFYETLGGELRKEINLSGLHSWFHGKNATSDQLAEDMRQGFQHFYSDLILAESDDKQTSPHTFDLTNQSTKELAKAYWAEMTRISMEVKSSRRHKGRHGVIVEGPPGRGKDVLLNVVEEHWRQGMSQQGYQLQAPIRVNAGIAGWDLLAAEIIRAKEQGRILIVSELNLLPTQYLEGKLNDVLSNGDASPGFFLFVTVNPSEFNGRKSFSPALESRFVRLKISDYTLEDYYSIALRLTEGLGISWQRAITFAQWHYALVQQQLKLRSSVVPTASNFNAMLKSLPATVASTDEAHFQQHYRLFLQGNKANNLSVTTGESSSKTTNDELRDWLHENIPGLASPITVTEGSSSGYDPASGKLTVLSLTDEKVREEAVKAIALQRALSHGLSTNGKTLNERDSWKILRSTPQELAEQELATRAAEKEAKQAAIKARAKKAAEAVTAEEIVRKEENKKVAANGTIETPKQNVSIEAGVFSDLNTGTGKSQSDEQSSYILEWLSTLQEGKESVTGRLPDAGTVMNYFNPVMVATVMGMAVAIKAEQILLHKGTPAISRVSRMPVYATAMTASTYQSWINTISAID